MFVNPDSNVNPDFQSPSNVRDAVFIGVQESTRLRDQGFTPVPDRGPTTQIGFRVSSHVLFNVVDRIIQQGQNLLSFPKTRSDFIRNATEIYAMDLIERGFVEPNTEIRTVLADLQLRVMERRLHRDRNLQKRLDELFRSAHEMVSNLVQEFRYETAGKELQGFLDDYTTGFLKTEPEIAGRALTQAMDDRAWQRLLAVLEQNGFPVKGCM